MNWKCPAASGAFWHPAGVRVVPVKDPVVFASLDHRLIAVTPAGVFEVPARWVLPGDDCPVQFPINYELRPYSGFFP
jgi:hypothetical protein